MRSFVKALIFAAVSLSFGSCGYTLQNSKNPRLREIGIRRVYVAPLINNTYKPGVENLIYNELVKTLVANNRVEIVPKKELADAILSGVVGEANYSISAMTSSNSLFPNRPDRPTIQTNVATEYKATVTCNFTLSRVPTPIYPPGQIWQASFQREKKFPGNNQRDEFGTTSALINESEFDRALRDIAQGMMGDVHESMLAMF